MAEDPTTETEQISLEERTERLVKTRNIIRAVRRAEQILKHEDEAAKDENAEVRGELNASLAASVGQKIDLLANLIENSGIPYKHIKAITQSWLLNTDGEDTFETYTEIALVPRYDLIYEVLSLGEGSVHEIYTSEHSRNVEPVGEDVATATLNSKLAGLLDSKNELVEDFKDSFGVWTPEQIEKVEDFLSKTSKARRYRKTTPLKFAGALRKALESRIVNAAEPIARRFDISGKKNYIIKSLKKEFETHPEKFTEEEKQQMGFILESIRELNTIKKQLHGNVLNQRISSIDAEVNEYISTVDQEELGTPFWFEKSPEARHALKLMCKYVKSYDPKYSLLEIFAHSIARVTPEGLAALESERKVEDSIMQLVGNSWIESMRNHREKDAEKSFTDKVRADKNAWYTIEGANHNMVSSAIYDLRKAHELLVAASKHKNVEGSTVELLHSMLEESYHIRDRELRTRLMHEYGLNSKRVLICTGDIEQDSQWSSLLKHTDPEYRLETIPEVMITDLGRERENYDIFVLSEGVAERQFSNLSVGFHKYSASISEIAATLEQEGNLSTDRLMQLMKLHIDKVNKGTQEQAIPLSSS